MDLFLDDAAGYPRAASLPLTENGIHPSASGHSILAERIGRQLGAPAPGFSIGIGRDTADADAVEGARLAGFTRSPNAVSFTATPARTLLPAAEEAGPRLRVQGLKSGRYVLRIDGEDAQVATHGDWDHLLGRLAFPRAAASCGRY